MSKKGLDNLSDAARDFFYFIQSFRNKLKLRDFVIILTVEDSIQDLDLDCDLRYLAKYKTKLNKKTIETLLNELFVLNDQEQLTTTLTTVTSQSHDSPVPEPTITYLLGIVDFGQVRKK